MNLAFTRAAGRAALAAAALALAACSAEPPLSPAPPAAARLTVPAEEAPQPGGSASLSSIYVIGSGRSDHPEE